MTGTPGGPPAPPSSALLIVEPDATIAQLLALAFGEEGHAVEHATSPHDALAILAARGPGAFSAILSAPCAPLAAPYAWLDRLRAWSRAPVVICTRQPAALYADYRARGYAAVIEEPCDLQEVLDVVSALCGGSAPAAPRPAGRAPRGVNDADV
jgi:DNA-binding response OmpR family regulator